MTSFGDYGVLKAAWPGTLTGKLSDVAGLALAPPVITVTLALLDPGYQRVRIGR